MKRLTISSLMIFFFVVGMNGISSAIPVTAESLADGVLSSPPRQWNQYVMFWDADSTYNQGSCIMLGLGGIFNVKSYIIQAGENEVNTLLYHDLSLPGTSYQAWEILNYDTSFLGMPVLLDSYDNTYNYSPIAPIITDQLVSFDKFSDSEQNFSASEIQTDGSQGPEPATMLLFGLGLTGLSRIRSRGNLS